MSWIARNECCTCYICLACQKGGIADHLTNVIMHALIDEGGLTHDEIASKLICFDADGVSTF